MYRSSPRSHAAYTTGLPHPLAVPLGSLRFTPSLVASKRAVESPELGRGLVRQRGMEARMNRRGGIDARVEARRDAGGCSWCRARLLPWGVVQHRSTPPSLTARPRSIDARIFVRRIHCSPPSSTGDSSNSDFPRAHGSSVLVQDNGELTRPMRSERYLVDAVLDLFNRQLQLRVLPVEHRRGDVIEGLGQSGCPVPCGEPELRRLTD